MIMTRAKPGPKMEPEWAALISAARAASRRAHAPYSQLRVGAAIAGRSGRSFRGCNVENSSFGLTVCAERAAVFRAVAEGERSFTRLVIYTPDAGPLAPCGACRQVLAEFCCDLTIVSVGRDGARRRYRLADLLPYAFSWPAGEDAGAAEAKTQGAGATD